LSLVNLPPHPAQREEQNRTPVVPPSEQSVASRKMDWEAPAALTRSGARWCGRREPLNGIEVAWKVEAHIPETAF